MDGSDVTVSSAQAYVDSLAAAYNSASSLMASSSYTQQAATPVCLPLTTGGMFEADELRLIPPAPAPLGETAADAVLTAAVPSLETAAGPGNTTAYPATAVTVDPASAVPTVTPAAAFPPAAALGATVLPSTAVTPAAAGVAPPAGGVAPTALPTAALLSNQAALQAAAAGLPPAAVAGPTSATLAAAAAANPANLAAANAAAMAAANPTMANLAAANAAAAAAAQQPNNMAAFNAMNAPFLMAAGLSAATALMPTGATPAQIAAGMPAVQAVPVMVSTQPPSSVSSLSGSTIGGTARGSTATTVNSELSTRLAAAGLGPSAAAAAAAGGGGLASGSFSALSAQSSALMASALPSMTDSQLSLSSLSNLKSASVASSVLSAANLGTGLGAVGQPTSSVSLLDPSLSTSPMSNAAAAAAAAAAAVAPSSGSSVTASGAKKVRVLLSSGGEYEELPMTSTDGTSLASGGSGRSMRWRYVGGETRLVGLSKTSSFSSFLQQLSKATSAVWDESCRLTYDLPGPDGDSGVLVDLIDDEDLEMMWEEFDSYASVRPGFKLHIYAQLGSKRGSAGGSSSTCASGDSHLKDAAGAGSCSGNTHTTGATDPTMAAAAAAAAASAGTNATAGTSSTGGLTSSEYEELVGEVVSESPHMNLADLEAKLEIIRPEDLQPVRLLGTGGFGEVYLCRWHSCDVAVKCLNPNLLVPDGAMGSISKDNVSELLKEASILGSVRHPNVVWVYGLVLPPLDAALELVRSHLAPGQGLDAVKVATSMANRHRQEVAVSQIRPPALVTEFLASGSLRAAITRRADFLSRDSVRIKLALDAARGMDYLHSKHIVHFDLKTANLLVGMRDKTPVCKVADMGLSKQKQQTFVTGVATLRGTLPWIAPEIIKTPATVTQAVDVYSFGVVLWELWTLKEPFEGLNYHALLHMMSSSTEPVRPPMPGSAEFEGDAGPEPAQGWQDLIAECLANNADQRPSFRQIVGRLESMLRTNRMAKRRTASGPAAASGTSGAQAAAGSLGVGSIE